jgi:hypothetical protein
MKKLVVFTLAMLSLSCNGNIFSYHEVDGLVAGLDSLIVTPHKTVYALDTSFDSSSDLSVFAVYNNGITKKTPVEAVAIEGIEDGMVPNAFTAIGAGAREVTLRYGGKATSYMITVGSVVEGGGSEESGGPSLDIGIGWQH